MKFLDLFAGIGGFRLGMEQAGHECVGYVEWDKYARKSYEAIHDTEGEWTAHDITAVTDEDIQSLRGRGIDIICGGFPCQAFSVAGKRGGFDDTRGTLFFEIARFAQQIKPRLLLLENVKGLLSHDQGNTFGTILHTLDELGYDTEWQVLNSKDFGVPQNRERVFLVGHLRTFGRREVFPIERNDQKTSNGIEIVGHSGSGGQKGYIHDVNGIVGALSATDYKQPKQIMVTGDGREPKIVIPVLTPDRQEKRQNGRRFKEDGEPAIIQKTRGNNNGGVHEIAPTVTSNSYQDNNHLIDGFRIRKLTPRECWRLQSFPDWAFDKAKEVNSDSQLYKQAGNSVTVNVIYEIARQFS